MINIMNLQKGAEHRLAVIGVPTYTIKPFVGLVYKWAQSSGPEWTTKRLKSLKVDLIRSFADEPYTAKWIRKNSRGEYYGVIGTLFRWCRESGNAQKARKRFSKVIQALNIYTYWTSEDVTSSQLKKFLDGVNSDPFIPLDWEFYSQFLKDVRIHIGHRSIERGGNSLIEYRGSPNKWSPIPFGGKRVRQDQFIDREIDWIDNPENFGFCNKYQELYAPVFSCMESSYHRKPKLSQSESMYGGEVHFLQEPGYKLRAIASPYRLHQMALTPLARAIYRIVESCPWDCTYKQNKAEPQVQAALRKGVMVSSIDLTGATDYFPLEMQSMVLREIFGDVTDIDLFEEISRMRWKSQIGDISWSRGQPLGLYPSFAAFTLTHGLLLLHLSGGIWKNDFYVVGDDVVILDQSLADRYIKFLDRIGCPWSPEKSITSNSLCEFAGKIITVDRVIPQYKWRKMSNDNFLDICRNLGPRSRELLSNRQRKVVDALWCLLVPVGLEFSRPGINLEMKIKMTDAFLSKIEKTVMGSLTDLNRKIHRFSYASYRPISLNNDVVQGLRDTFDKKVSLVFQQLVVGRLLNLLNVYSEGLPQALGLYPRLPAKDVSPSRVTSLVRYEVLLQAAGLL